MGKETAPKNSGSVFRRLGQALGLITNDDGTWGPARIETARSREYVAQTKRDQNKN